MPEESTVAVCRAESSWYVTAPASPHSYAQFRVYEGPMSEPEARREVERRGDRYSVMREGTLSIAKVVDNRE